MFWVFAFDVLDRLITSIRTSDTCSFYLHSLFCSCESDALHFSFIPIVIPSVTGKKKHVRYF